MSLAHLLPNNAEMSEDDELPPYVENGKPGHFEMDARFCARMHAAIAGGLESAPIGVITTPGTKNPKYVAKLTASSASSRNER